jgi:hypothetical protein
MDTTESPAQDGPLPRTEDEARRITAAAAERGVTAQALGGVAIFLRCPSAEHPPLQREYKDVDLVSTRSMTERLTELLTSLGHSPDKRFNALHGSQRLFFWDERNGRQLDVFVERFEMCHSFDLRNRLKVDPLAPTLPLADLLLTKMQIVEMNQKDMMDLSALLQDHPLTENEDGINVQYITRLTRSDWGLQRTLEKTIERLASAEDVEQLKAVEPRYDLSSQLSSLMKAMQDAPKSTGWKLRSKIGEHKRWYELPEEARA